MNPKFLGGMRARKWTGGKDTRKYNQFSSFLLTLIKPQYNNKQQEQPVPKKDITSLDPQIENYWSRSVVANFMST